MMRPVLTICAPPLILRTSWLVVMACLLSFGEAQAGEMFLGWRRDWPAGNAPSSRWAMATTPGDVLIEPPVTSPGDVPIEVLPDGAVTAEPVVAPQAGASGLMRSWEINNLFTGPEQSHVEAVDQYKLDRFFYEPFWQFTGDLYEDTLNFYSRRGLIGLGLATGGAALLANTSADENFRNWFLENVRDNSPDTHWAKNLGEVWIVPPLIALTWGITEYREANPASRGGAVNNALLHWSRQSTRAFLISAIPVYGLQWITGASRPGEDPAKGSSWKPFDDNNGVSGHAAVGAIPFLVAAKQTRNPWLKAGFYFGSTLAGYSRIYDDVHFLSQVLFGYAIAYLAVEATEYSNRSGLGYRVVPLTLTGTYGLAVERRW